MNSPDQLSNPTDRTSTYFTTSDWLCLCRASLRVIPGVGPRAWLNRYRFLAQARKVPSAVVPFLRPQQNAFGRFIAERPEAVGAVVWPYINKNWDAATRLSRIHDHFHAVEAAIPVLNFEVHNERELVDLGDLLPGLRVVLDQAVWFMREGQLVVNLFAGETRIFSLAFSLRLEPALTAYIGAIQGRNIEGVLDTYREITGALFGMRPRDFLVEVFRSLCRATDVSRIFAISDTSRHHRSAYFGDGEKTFSLNYDEVWRERGGSPSDSDFYVLPVENARRALADVPSKKRGMYRRRYELLDRIEERIAEVLLRR